MNKKVVTSGVFFTCIGLAGQTLAHSPMCTCYDNGDKTITCEGAFSDGSSAAGTVLQIKGVGGKIITQGKMDKTGTCTFKKPTGDYKVVFDGGPGHQIEINDKNIK